MDDNSALSLFPKTRIKPYDGMSITADVWAQAHEEHRKARQAHDVLFHGPGIITGLEVQANDPPDQYVFISPGAAVDETGNVIVLDEPVAYDFGAKAEGLLYLLLGHGERESGGVDKDVRQIHSEFVVAARSSFPKRPAVELARVRISEAGKPIRNPENAAHPTIGELDLRFRAQVGPQPRQQVYIGLFTFGREVEDVRAGWRFLAAECERSSPYHLILDGILSASDELTAYDLVYLSAKGAFNPESATAKSLQAYLKQGKVLLAEALDEEAGKSFAKLFEQLGQKTTPLAANSPLLETPFLFAEPPLGANPGNLQAGKQIVFSTSGYSLAWAGKLPFETRSRADIRNAHEWGVNLIQYCLRRSSP
jgi:hypothetical protein